MEEEVFGFLEVDGPDFFFFGRKGFGFKVDLQIIPFDSHNIFPLKEDIVINK